ncbi:alpha/beta hydrolase [Treponema parvum]|uniref:Alpha/beta hydrolase n=1 Tax=Treponema parvum TaxID=138851 RepID=A0A975IEK0_9SPIR|nr:alpha/beta hydrolase [Treponema parvum]QTQ14026.1 alpha/beta hydrolase [Treponema parvum]
MQKETFFQTMRDGAKVSVIRWIPECEPKDIRGLFQISHGMVDHALRYEVLAQFMTENGYVCSAHDHRGHGKTGEKAQNENRGKLGFVAEKDGFTAVVEDLREVIEKFKRDYPEKEIILFAHSFGSFVGQAFIEKYGSIIQKCVLCGTAFPSAKLIYTGLFFVGTAKNLFGAKECVPFVNMLFFKMNNKKIKRPLSPHSWISRDENEVEKYDRDPFCNFMPTLGFFYDLLWGLNFVRKQKNINSIPCTMPILFISGEEDPVGSYSSAVKKLYKIYKASGKRNVSIKIYKGCRHELINEINRRDVFRDLLFWIKAGEVK